MTIIAVILIVALIAALCGCEWYHMTHRPRQGVITALAATACTLIVAIAQMRRIGADLGEIHEVVRVKHAGGRPRKAAAVAKEEGGGMIGQVMSVIQDPTVGPLVAPLLKNILNPEKKPKTK